MEDHHSWLHRQMTEDMGLRVEPPPPLLPLPGNAVFWHHRSGPIGGGLNVVDAAERTTERAAIRAAISHILMTASPSLTIEVKVVVAAAPAPLAGIPEKT